MGARFPEMLCSTPREHPDPKQRGCEELLHRLDGADIALGSRRAFLGPCRELGELSGTAAGGYFRAAAGSAPAVALKAGNRFADYAAHLAR